MENNNDGMYSDVIVIGAGLAGLACASELERKSKLKVTVVEARHRIGGRVHTIGKNTIGQDAHWPCQIEMGGQWVHSAKPHHPLAVVAKQAGVAIKKHDWDDAVYVSTGTDRPPKLIPQVEVERAWTTTEHFFDKAETISEGKSGTSVG